MKKLFITGGGGEIGGAIVAEFIKHNFEIIAPNSKELDLASETSITDYMSNFSSPIDVFIHCAGFNNPKPFAEITATDFDKTMDINANSFYHLTQTLINKSLFKDNSYILAISSIYSTVSRKKRFSYVAAKHCLNGMIKTLALELAEFGIIVNALSPGFVATKMTYKNNSPAVIEEIVKKIPLARLAIPSDMAKVAYFLCSSDNLYISGQNIIADGGYTIGGFEQ